MFEAFLDLTRQAFGVDVATAILEQDAPPGQSPSPPTATVNRRLAPPPAPSWRCSRTAPVMVRTCCARTFRRPGALPWPPRWSCQVDSTACC